MNAQPGPMVSGSHFFPKAPLLCVKWMPAWAVMSRKVMVCAGTKSVAASRKGNSHHGDTEARRKALLALSSWLLAKGQKLNAKSGLTPCRVSVMNFFFIKVCITFGPRWLWRRELRPRCARLGRAGRPSPHVPGFARLDGRGRPSLRESLLAAGLICAHGCFGVRCCLRD